MKLNATALLFAFVCIVQSSFLSSQPVPKSRPPEVDHVALHVYDLQRSAAFYEKVMTLERLPEPFKDGRHAWFRIGTNEQLHLIGGAPHDAKRDIDVHFALRVPSLPNMLNHLERMKVKYFSTKHEERAITTRPDGIKQVYVQDPDGFWIEINDIPN